MTIVRAALAAVLLGGPTVLAFFSGGYFDRPRLWAGLAAWACVVLAGCFSVRPWPRTRAAWLALGGIAAFTAWTLLSIGWSPLHDEAAAEAELAALYLGTLIAGIAMLRSRGVARAAEPALAFGIVIVICEGLSERVFPGIFTLATDPTTAGRLEQPLTYWNAMAILAAMGFVLLARVAGDSSRPAGLRIAAVAGSPPVGLGLYLTVSRGGLLAAAIGLVALVRLAPSREQGRAVLLVVLAAIPAVAAAVALDDVRSLMGDLGTRERDGLIVLGLMVAGAAGSCLALRWHQQRDDLGADGDAADPLLRRIASAACVLVAVVTVAAFVSAALSRVKIDVAKTTSPTNSRLVTTDSVRGNFWSVAMSGFVHHPLRGLGAGGFETEWGRQRTILYYTRNAHSLYVETLCDLGIVGALALIALIAGVVAGARRAYRRDPRLSAGWIAVVGMWAVHAGLDWDWEMPTVSLVAFVLMAAIIALAESDDGSSRAADTSVPALQRPFVSAGTL